MEIILQFKEIYIITKLCIYLVKEITITRDLKSVSFSEKDLIRNFKKDVIMSENRVKQQLIKFKL